MSNYILPDDYKPYITDGRKNQIIGNDTTILDTVEETAIQEVKDALFPKYDVDSIFAKTGTARDKQVVRWCVVLAVYFIYERVPDIQIPEKIRLAYEEVRLTLEAIEDGKKSVMLPVATDEEDVIKTKFRWGSQPPREHNTQL